MEFHIEIPGPAPDPRVIENAISDVDPAALVDIDPTSHKLRIATSLGAQQLVALIARAGYPVGPSQVRQLPSICCGGCSG